MFCITLFFQPKISNSYGTSDNVVKVTQSDFNVFAALKEDEVFVKQEQARRGTARGKTSCDLTPHFLFTVYYYF